MSSRSQTAEARFEQQERETTTMFGFWVYLMTDCVLFASLFATYAVLHGNTAGGEGPMQLFSLPLVLVETLVLLVSSLLSGFGLLAAKAGKRQQALLLLGITAILGLVFLGIELSEFHHLYVEGNSWRRSGFLSAFFTLVGTHGLHITVGLLWLAVLAIRIMRSGLTQVNLRRLTLFTVFWHFLDLIWIFIFTIVYLGGRLGL